MPEVDIEERKLQYLNRSANVQSDKEQRELDKDYADVLRHMAGDKPARAPVFSPSGEATALTIENLIGAFGALEVAKGALAQLDREEFEEFAIAGQETAVALGYVPPLPVGGTLDLTNRVDGDMTALEAVQANLPVLTLDELNQVFEALGPLIDAGGAPDGGNPPSVVPVELAPGFPSAWRDLQWKAKVKLANSLGGQVANATEADTFLTNKEAELKKGA